FRSLLETASGRGTTNVRAEALLMRMIEQDDSDRGGIWHQIGQDPFVAEAVCTSLEDYSAESLLDHPEDVAGLADLLSSDNAELVAKAGSLLADIGSRRALRALGEANWKPEGWAASNVLRGLAVQIPWDEGFSGLLDV